MNYSIFNDVIFGVLIFTLVLVVAGVVVTKIINKVLEARFNGKIEKMTAKERKEQLAQLSFQLGEHNTSHILHAILTVFCLGFWIIPWIYVSLSNKGRRVELQKRIVSLEVSNVD